MGRLSIPPGKYWVTADVLGQVVSFVSPPGLSNISCEISTYTTSGTRISVSPLITFAPAAGTGATILSQSTSGYLDLPTDANGVQLRCRGSYSGYTTGSGITNGVFLAMPVAGVIEAP